MQIRVCPQAPQSYIILILWNKAELSQSSPRSHLRRTHSRPNPACSLHPRGPMQPPSSRKMQSHSRELWERGLFTLKKKSVLQCF